MAEAKRERQSAFYYRAAAAAAVEESDTLRDVPGQLRTRITQFKMLADDYADLEAENRELRERVSDLEERLRRIADLASWHADTDADPDNTSPDDMTAHVNGLIIKECE